MKVLDDGARGCQVLEKTRKVAGLFQDWGVESHELDKAVAPSVAIDIKDHRIEVEVLYWLPSGEWSQLAPYCILMYSCLQEPEQL